MDPWVHLAEKHESDTDHFGITAYVAVDHGGKVQAVRVGGAYIQGWSTMTPEVQAIVRNDLREVAERDANDWIVTNPGRHLVDRR
jgi:hypothetical protein